MITSILGADTLMALVNGKPYSLTADNPHFEKIRAALIAYKNPGTGGTLAAEDAIEEMFSVATAVKKFLRDGEVTIDGGLVSYRGVEVHGKVIDRILDFKSRSLPFQPLIAFLQRLMENPSKRAVEELYGFIEANKMPITPDGFILGYKGVTAEYKDVHTGKIDNQVGAKPPRFARNQVDDNWRTLCSSGYHVGSKNYAANWGDKTVIVKIDPADVVSVPDSCFDKMRVTYYEVVSDYEGELPEAIAIAEKPYAAKRTVKSILKRLFGLS